MPNPTSFDRLMWALPPLARSYALCEKFEEAEAAANEALAHFRVNGSVRGQAFALNALGVVAVRRGVRLLDVASGPGYLAAAAAQRGADVVGVDFADSMVDQARRIYPALTFRIGSAEDLPFPDDDFDAVGISFGDR